MDYKFSSEMDWSKGVSTDHEVELDLNLALDKILPFHNLALRLQADEHQVRKEIADVVLRHILPKIIKDTSLEHTTPGHLRIEANSKSHSRESVYIPTLPQNMLMFRGRLQIVMNLKANKPVNAIQALYGNRLNVATDIANMIVRSLKTAIFKRDIDEETHTSTSSKGDTIDNLTHKSNRPTGENN